MDAAALVASLLQAVPDTFETAVTVDLHPTFYVSRHFLWAASRDSSSLKFSFLAEVTAVDYWPRDPRFEIVYVLVSLEHKHRARMKVRVSGGDAHLATVSTIWPAANCLEREVWDLFGIRFGGHRAAPPADARRWEGFPPRKDSPVQTAGLRMWSAAGHAEEFRNVNAIDWRANNARTPHGDDDRQHGAQHPSTHGVLRLVLELDGEQVLRVADDRLPPHGHREDGRAEEGRSSHCRAQTTWRAVEQHGASCRSSVWLASTCPSA
jgi:NADH:ubiquinone oxidoreductase subunit C